MQKSKFGIIVLVAGAVMLYSCKKDNPQTSTSTGTTTSTSGFTWTAVGGAPVVADNAYYILAYSNILGIKNGTSGSVDITLDTLKAKSFIISPGAGITLLYGINSATYSAKSGTVTITSYTNNKLTGNFTAIFPPGTAGGLSGQFTDLPPH